jgi:hypothetical protein
MFWSALPLSLKFQQFHRRTSSASLFLGNHPPVLFIALLLLVN